MGLKYEEVPQELQKEKIKKSEGGFWGEGHEDWEGLRGDRSEVGATGAGVRTGSDWEARTPESLERGQGQFSGGGGGALQCHTVRPSTSCLKDSIRTGPHQKFSLGPWFSRGTRVRLPGPWFSGRRGQGTLWGSRVSHGHGCDSSGGGL